VQTPTLYAVVKREEERAKQTDKIYYEVVGTFHSETYQGVLQTQAMLETVKEAQAVAGNIAVGSEGVISSYQNKVVAVAPQLLYDLTTLQKEVISFPVIAMNASSMEPKTTSKESKYCLQAPIMAMHLAMFLKQQ